MALVASNQGLAHGLRCGDDATMERTHEMKTKRAEPNIDSRSKSDGLGS